MGLLQMSVFLNGRCSYCTSSVDEETREKESEEETDGEISKGIGNVGGRQEVYKHSELY